MENNNFRLSIKDLMSSEEIARFEGDLPDYDEDYSGCCDKGHDDGGDE